MNVKGMIIYNNKNIKVLDVTVDDNSYRYRVIKGDHNLTLHYSLAEHVEIPVGSYCIYQGERYTLERPEAFKMKHSRNFEYTVTLESNQAKAKIWKFRNPVDGRLKFSLTAKPIEHLQMFVDNMNRRDTGWEVGECIDGTETLINYNHVYCWDAIGMMATEFNTEFEFVGKTVHLRKVEYNKNNPLPLSYGRGNGFKPGVGRSNYGDTPPIEILYVQGGTDNIDPSKYKSSELLLPAGQNIQYDGVYFEGDPNFNPANARTYVVDDLGYSIRRSDKELTSLAEDSLDCTDIYPKRIGKVTSVVVEDADNNFYDIVDNTIPNTLNYEECLIEGETMTIVFQSGMLAGREFEVKYYHNAEKGKAARRFEIVPAEIDGQTMPNATFAPQTTDTYVVFKCRMPDAYVRDDETKTGASWDMFRAAVKYLFDNEEQKFSFTGELDGIWSKKDWINISGKIKLGGYIRFSNEHFQKDGVLVRITGIKDYINKPHSPEIELSNSTVGGSFSTTLKQLESDEVLVEDYHRDAIQFTKRRFRDAKETMEMLEDALLDNFTNSINPIAIQTMQMLVGDESLQFRFVNSKTNPVGVSHRITYDNTTKQLTAAAGIIQHLTIGVSSLSSSHAASEYRYWGMPKYTSGRLDNGETKYYLYAKVSKTTQTGSFLLSETAIKLEGVSGYYHLLVGVLNSEYDGVRSFATLYGFSEILPGRITTDRIVSGNGDSYFDMLANAMKLGSVLDFNSEGDGKLRLKGTLVQSQSGEENYIGCFRGKYNSSYTYYQGDEVTYTVNNNTSTYRYINATPSRGIAPTNTVYWQIIAQGSKGENGADGSSPVMVYRGVYDSSKTYYGNKYRLDCVKQGSTYYIARVDAGTFKGIAPPDANKWNSFGASFESIATNLLLAEGANIGDWFIKSGKIVSTLASGDVIALDAKNNRIQITSARSGGDYSMETSLGSIIRLDAYSGIVETRSKTNNYTSYMSPSGLFANRAGTQCVAASSGYDQRASVCGLGWGDLSKSAWSLGADEKLVAGVYGTASNSSTAPYYGGYFRMLKAMGLVYGTKYITSSGVYLTDYMSLVVGFTNGQANVYLPASSREGQTIILKQWWTGYMRIYPRSGQKLYDDNTENEYYDVGCGQEVIAHFVRASINGEKVQVWLLNKYKF